MTRLFWTKCDSNVRTRSMRMYDVCKISLLGDCTCAVCCVVTILSEATCDDVSHRTFSLSEDHERDQVCILLSWNCTIHCCDVRRHCIGVGGIMLMQRSQPQFPWPALSISTTSYGLVSGVLHSSIQAVSPWIVARDFQLIVLRVVVIASTSPLHSTLPAPPSSSARSFAQNDPRS